MKIKELKSKSDNELQKILAESREKLRELRFKLSSGQVKNVREIREVRKTIAQILTLLKERQTQNDKKTATTKALKKSESIKN